MLEQGSPLSPEAVQFLDRLKFLQDHGRIPAKVLREGMLGPFLSLHPELLSADIPEPSSPTTKRKLGRVEPKPKAPEVG